MASVQAHQDLQHFFAMLIMGTAMSEITTGRMPLKALTTYGLSLKEVNSIAMARMMQKDGVMDPSVAAMLPFTPLKR